MIKCYYLVTSVYLLLSIYIRFPLTFRAINLCVALKIGKISVLALNKVEVGHP
jgi:hypothetical protein